MTSRTSTTSVARFSGYSNKTNKTNKKIVLQKEKFIIALLSLLIIISFVSIFSTQSYSYKEPAYVTINIKSGDTLWNIAKERCGNQDIRKYIYNIKKINKMTNSTIYPGNQIKLPS